MAKNNVQYQVIVSRKAASMLMDCAAFIARVSETGAMAFLDEFERQAQSLQTNPFRCPLLHEEYLPQNKYRKMILHTRYILLYQVKEQNVYVDYVLDGRQDYGHLLLD